jgi:hypothetical protein
VPALQQGDLLTELLEKNGGKGTSLWQYLTLLEKDDKPRARHSQAACRSVSAGHIAGGPSRVLCLLMRGELSSISRSCSKYPIRVQA